MKRTLHYLDRPEQTMSGASATRPAGYSRAFESRRGDAHNAADNAAAHIDYYQTDGDAATLGEIRAAVDAASTDAELDDLMERSRDLERTARRRLEV